MKSLGKRRFCRILNAPTINKVGVFQRNRSLTKVMKILVASLSSFLLLAACFPVLISGQAVSGVTGLITDSNGAVIPGVEVKLADTKTSREYSTKSNEQGIYLFQNIPPGEGYKITLSLQGFQTSVISEVRLNVAKIETYNAQLTAGQVSETVQITSSTGATLNTTDASIGNVIDTQQLRDLPIQIRNSPAALIGLQPGVIGNNVGTAATNRVGSVTGSRADQGNITVDGIDSNDQATGQAFATTGNAPIDSIQEFRAVSSNPLANEGRSSGGQIQLVTKSGTNEFHGSLREYNRTAATAANSFFNNKNGVPRPQLTRNQFGGSLSGPLPLFNFGEGGPIFRNGKDKVFFFFDYEGRRDAQGITYTRIVPLNHFRNGGLGYINNTAGCTSTSRLNTTPQCISILTPQQVAALDPKGIGPNQNLLNFINQRYPLPNDLTLGDGVNTGGFRFNAPTKRAENTFTTRFDIAAAKNQKVFVRFNIVDSNITDTTNSVAQQFPGDPETAQIVIGDYSWAAGHSWVINPNLFNQLTIGNAHSDLDFPILFNPTFPTDYSGGGFGILSDPFAGLTYQNRIVEVPTIRDDVTWTLGSHSIQFGGQFKPIRQKSTLVNDLNFPVLGLGGNTTSLIAALRPTNIRPTTTATSLYDNAFALLLGRMASVLTNFNYKTDGTALPPGSGKKRDFRYNEYELYAQNYWKVRNDLSLNFGVRWHFYPAPYEANGFQVGNDVDFERLFNLRQQNAAAGISGSNAEPFLKYDLIGKKNNGRPFYQSDRNNFAPRFGFAYNPSFESGILGKLFGDKKTSIRGGGSVVYDRVAGTLSFVLDQLTYKFDNSARTNFGSANPITALLNDPRFSGINNVPVQNSPPVINSPSIPFVEGGIPVGNARGQFNYALAQNFKIPYSIQYSFGVQRELPGNFLLDVSYVGRQARKLFAQADAAQILDFKDTASGQFMISAFNKLQAEIIAGGPVTPQPWFENQINPVALANYGAPCTAFGVANCTQLVATFFGGLVQNGDTSDTIQALYSNALLNPNVGLSGQFSVNAYVTNLASSSYNGMLVSLQKRFSQGFRFDVNYTWSHSIDNQSSVANTVTGGLICDVRNLRVCRGNSDFDIRHLVNVHGIFDVPVGRGKAIGGNMPNWLNTILGGWTISGIYTYRSGLPFNTTTGSFPVGFFFDSPGVFNNNSAAVLRKIRDEGNAIVFFADLQAAQNAFRNPTHGETGNRNNLRSSAFWNLDTAVLKKFKLPWEGQSLELRWESYNAFNHNVFGFPNTNINSTSFGRVTTSASSPRVMQFALRYDF